MSQFDWNKTFPEVFACKDGWSIRKDRSGPIVASYVLLAPDSTRIAFVHTSPEKLAVALGYTGPMPEYEPECD